MIKIKSFIIILISLIFYLSFDLESRPTNIPLTADYDENLEIYSLFIGKYPNQIQIIWEDDGEIGSISIIDDKIKDTTNFDKGRWLSRKSYNSNTLKFIEKLPPINKPETIPKTSNFNFDFNKWESGDTISSKKNGIWKLWWPSGHNAGTIEYESNLYNGWLKMDWENGNRETEVKYVNGKREGVRLDFYENGMLLEKSNYVDGNLDGVMEIYNSEGELARIVVFDKGKLIKRTILRESEEEIKERLSREKRRKKFFNELKKQNAADPRPAPLSR
jgi:antitoxin component YwqK of YwqJK toxin-antitoxin module